MAGLLDRSRTVAPPGFNRWLVPPAALCIHLCIGMAYGFSVFWLPLTHGVGIDHSVVPPPEATLAARLVSTEWDWDKPLLGWLYTLFFVFLGSSAALFGTWLERVGPRKAAFVSACCWCGGLLLSALAVRWHQLWLLWLGAGVIGGIGLGLGYISPVSTLMKWFPDRRGLATGLAIMGFGGGAMIGSPLADRLMKHFQSATSVGVAETFITLALIYLAFMMLGAFAYRVPPEGWRPAGWAGPRGGQAAGKARSFTAAEACRTPQFWLLWGVLLCNVSAGIGVIGMASPMLQEVFGGRLIGSDRPFEELDAAELARTAAVAAGFTGLLSLFNIVGRLFWSSLSDRIGRRATYAIFLVAGAGLFALVPVAGRAGSVAAFCALLCLALTMYGGGFAAIPAYLADLFGTGSVGAIHGRLLTAWSVAGVLGPVLVNYLNEAQLRAGIPRARAYDQTMLALSVVLLAGAVCNWLVRPIEAPEMGAAARGGDDPAPMTGGEAFAAGATQDSAWGLVIAFWCLVGLPLAWGVWITLWQSWRLLG